jgi:hypothetical protein
MHLQNIFTREAYSFLLSFSHVLYHTCDTFVCYGTHTPYLCDLWYRDVKNFVCHVYSN